MEADSNITLRQLRYFVAAAETGQFSMAATRTHVSQSAITNAVLLLEQTLGTRLFERLPHGVALTAEGHRFHQHASHILSALQDAVREPRFQAPQQKGVLRIAASYTLLGYFLPPLLARFRMSYPEVQIDLHDMNREGIEQAVLEGCIDMGVVILSNVVERERRAGAGPPPTVDLGFAPAAGKRLGIPRGHCGLSLHPAHRGRKRSVHRPLLGGQRNHTGASLSNQFDGSPARADRPRFRRQHPV